LKIVTTLSSKHNTQKPLKPAFHDVKYSQNHLYIKFSIIFFRRMDDILTLYFSVQKSPNTVECEIKIKKHFVGHLSHFTVHVPEI